MKGKERKRKQYNQTQAVAKVVGYLSSSFLSLGVYLSERRQKERRVLVAGCHGQGNWHVGVVQLVFVCLLGFFVLS